MLKMLPCLDSDALAKRRQWELDLPRHVAADLRKSALEAGAKGYYVYGTDRRIDWSRVVQSACRAKVSIPLDAPLPAQGAGSFAETRIQVTNETTLAVSRRLVEGGARPLALNFANGVRPGGGFLGGARAQEEVLCRSSALYHTLVDDEMYAAHLRRSRPDSTAWAIYSPDVPVFRADDGTELEQPWLLSFLSCAAPYANDIGQPEAGELLQRRLQRVLNIARAYGHTALVLGAWGCGAFGNDAHRLAVDFRHALETEFVGAFSEVVFAITDWSPERRFLGPFRDVFAPEVAEPDNLKNESEPVGPG